MDTRVLVGVLLQRLDEVREHRVDRAHRAEGPQRLTRGRARIAAAEDVVGATVHGGVVVGRSSELGDRRLVRARPAWLG